MSEIEPAPQVRRSPIDRWWPLRAVVFTLLAVAMLAGPFVPQVLGRHSPFIRAWTMFSLVGLGLADVRFSVRQPDGTLVPLDQYATLGYEHLWQVPLEVRRVTRMQGVEKMARQLCDRLGPQADLRARVRLAYRTGWRVELMESDRNLCATGAAR